MISVRNMTKSSPPLARALLSSIQERILGKQYELSLVFAGDVLSRRLNRERRGKDGPANTLSFALTKNSGEIFINMRQVARDAEHFGERPRSFALRLFIHSLLHLKGFSHGSIMDSEERKYGAHFRRFLR